MTATSSLVESGRDHAPASTMPVIAAQKRHAAIVRLTHWLTTLCFLALLVSGLEIVVSHPRFYWGESGNVPAPALFSLADFPRRGQPSRPGMASCCRTRTAGAAISISRRRGLLVLTGALYVIWGVVSGHFRQ